MHPAGEFEAFRTLIEAGRDVEDMAARFGVSVLTTQRRQKLSAVSPKLLALYRQDGIYLDQLMALSLTDSHEAQERAWFEARPWDRTPAALWRTLTAGEGDVAGSALVRFVGIERLASGKREAITVPLRDEGWTRVKARIDPKALRTLVVNSASWLAGKRWLPVSLWPPPG